MKKRACIVVVVLAAVMALALNGCSKKEKEKLGVQDAISEIAGEYQGHITSEGFEYSTSDARYLSIFKAVTQKYEDNWSGSLDFKVMRISDNAVELDWAGVRFKSKEIVNLPQSVCMNLDNTRTIDKESDGAKATLTLSPIINPDTRDQSGKTYSVYYSKKDKQISVALNAELKTTFTGGMKFEGTIRWKMYVRGTKK